MVFLRRGRQINPRRKKMTGHVSGHKLGAPYDVVTAA